MECNICNVMFSESFLAEFAPSEMDCMTLLLKCMEKHCSAMREESKSQDNQISSLIDRNSSLFKTLQVKKKEICHCCHKEILSALDTETDDEDDVSQGIAFVGGIPQAPSSSASISCSSSRSPIVRSLINNGNNTHSNIGHLSRFDDSFEYNNLELNDDYTNMPTTSSVNKMDFPTCSQSTNGILKTRGNLNIRDGSYETNSTPSFFSYGIPNRHSTDNLSLREALGELETSENSNLEESDESDLESDAGTDESDGYNSVSDNDEENNDIEEFDASNSPSEDDLEESEKVKNTKIVGDLPESESSTSSTDEEDFGESEHYVPESDDEDEISDDNQAMHGLHLHGDDNEQNPPSEPFTNRYTAATSTAQSSCDDDSQPSFSTTSIKKYKPTQPLRIDQAVSTKDNVTGRDEPDTMRCPILAEKIKTMGRNLHRHEVVHHMYFCEFCKHAH